MDAFFFAVVFVLNLVVLLAAFRRFSIKRMSFLFLFYWVINIVVAFAVFSTSVEWKLSGITFLLFCVDVFCIFYTLVETNQNRASFSSDVWNGKEKSVNLVLLICFFAGIAYMILELVNNGFSLSNLTSISGLMETGYYFTDGRYGGSTVIHVSTHEQICLTINYSGFILAGYVYNLKITKKWICFIQFIPMILSMLATTAKTPFISGIFLWICGYLVASNFEKSVKKETLDFQESGEKKKKISLTKILLIGIGAVLLFYFSFYIRYGSGYSTNIWNRIIMYAFGHVPCYDEWYSSFKLNLFGYSHGQQTFMLFFGDQMPAALERVYISPRFSTKYSWTNVITLFAYVLMDFGYIGAVLFFAFFGIIAGYSISCLKANGGSVAHAVVGLCYYIIIYSFLVSPLRYLSIVGAFFLFGVYVFLLLRVRYGGRK